MSVWTRVMDTHAWGWKMKKQAISGIPWVYVCCFGLTSTHSVKGPWLPSSLVMQFVWGWLHPHPSGVPAWPRPGQCPFPLATVTQGQAWTLKPAYWDSTPGLLLKLLENRVHRFSWGPMLVRSESGTAGAHRRHPAGWGWSWLRRKQSHKKELDLRSHYSWTCNYIVGAQIPFLDFFSPSSQFELGFCHWQQKFLYNYFL